MIAKTVAAATLATIAAASPALALTVVNKSGSEVSIGLDMGDKESVHKIAAGQSVTFKNECDNACGVTGPWSYSWLAKTGDKIETDGKSLVTVTK